jgi:NADH-quinone oxidoreductase subunit N
MVESVLQNLAYFVPETVLAATFCAVLLADVLFKGRPRIPWSLGLIGVAIAGTAALQQAGLNRPAFDLMIVVDPFAVFIKVVVAATAILIFLMSLWSEEVKASARRMGEYAALLVSATLGMFLMAGASNVLMIVLALELTGLSSYVLSGYTKEAGDSSEASLKYILFGAVSTGIMLYGISLLYGLTGATDLIGIRLALQGQATINAPLLLIAGIMILAGLGYKISAVPFHFWTPDVYEGAPITVTAFLSVASKAAGFALMIRFIVSTVTSTLGVDVMDHVRTFEWPKLIAILSVLTMTLGNIVAIWQDNLKRLLAYSSIAHAGYMLMAVVVFSQNGVAAVLVYFVVYLFMNLGAFYLVMLIAGATGSEDIASYKGLGHRAPLVGVSLVIFLVSLTGLPPTAGFIGKLYVFSALLDAKWIWLAVVGALNSVVSLYYYVRIIRNMYLREPETPPAPVILTGAQTVLLLVFLVPTLGLGLYFAPLVDWAHASAVLFGIR